MLGPLFASIMMKEAYRNGDRFHIYLSGPMTGLPNYNRPAFNAAAKQLRSEGKTVFNPAELGEPDPIHDRAWYMRRDIEGLLKSDVVYVLPGWEESDGAKLEIEIAKQLDVPIVFTSHPSVDKAETNE
jgi:hypothetical protein